QLDQNLDSKLLEEEELINHWQKLWSPMNISPLSPREMAAWISKVKEITSLGEKLESLLLDKEKTDKMIHSITESSKEVLTMEGVEVSEQTDFITLTALVEEHREKASQQISARKNLEHDLKKTSNRLKKLELKYNELTDQTAEKKNLWKQAVQELNIDPLQNPQEVSQEIKICSEISESLKYLKKLETSKNALTKKCREFSSQVMKLVHKIGDKESSDSRPEDVVNNAYKKLQKEQEKHARKKDLQDRLDNTAHKLSELKKEFKILEDNLELLCQEAGTEDPENLTEIEKKAGLAAELRSKLDHINSRLLELAAGEDLNTFMSKALNLGPDELQATIHDLKKRQEEKEPDLETLIKKITEKELQLKQMDGTSQVPDFEQQVQEQRAVLETNVEQYISLRLAAHILSAEIERYRAANQGPVLQNASEVFRKITLDSFSRIMADYDEKGDPIIKAVRKNDTALQVQDLSDGSRDQLFLALRLGGIYRYLQENPPFPFMVDDILVHFDDERSIKTLSVLTELSRETQVLFFTHHRHLVDLASSIPEKNMVNIHELKQD
ncbi:MAG: ATP-binding protein, partial [Desulfonatronovibrio sp.]